MALLTSSERELLFPNVPSAAERNWEWIDPTRLDEAGWRLLLDRHQPRVIVTGWSSPALPPGYAKAEGGPVEYVCNATGTVRHVVSREQIAQGLRVTNWGSFVGPLVAEHALLLVLGSLRNLPAWPRSGEPEPAWSVGSYQTKTLFKKRVGVYGFGSIARAFLDLLKPFETKRLVYSAAVSESFIQAHGAEAAGSLATLFEQSEILVCCESLTRATEGSIDAALFAKLPRGAVFVNVGRGGLVDEAAMISAIVERELRVGLDVFVQEPLPPESPFWRLPGVIVSPHIGGPTDDASVQCGQWAEQNVERFLEGREPIGLISTEIFDRAT